MSLLKKFCLIISFLPVYSFAQTNYKPGYVINMKGDTVRGYIDYRVWQTNPKRISFKTDATGSTQTFSINDIKGFRLLVGHLEEYVRYEGRISTNDVDIAHLIGNHDTSSRQDVVFLNVLQKGPRLILYSYTDNLKTRFFISEGSDKPPVELLYDLYYSKDETGSDNRTTYVDTYKQQLYLVAEKDGVLSKKLKVYIEKASYDENDLVYIAAKINGVSLKDAAKNNRSETHGFYKIFAIGAAVIVAIVWISEIAGHHTVGYY